MNNNGISHRRFRQLLPGSSWVARGGGIPQLVRQVSCSHVSFVSFEPGSSPQRLSVAQFLSQYRRCHNV